MTTSTANEAFDIAYQRFLDSLPEVERNLYTPCASAEDLLDGLAKLTVLSVKRQIRSKSLIGTIASCNKRLQPYFDIVTIFAQSNQYACIAWGALRLVLQLASNFTNFFEKLIELIQSLMDAFPQYGEIMKIFSGKPPERMKQNVEKLYGDLLQFFQSVAQIFVTTRGSIRRSPAVVCDLLWTPFDVRFKDLLTQLEYHKELVTSELILANARASKDIQKALEYEQKLAAKERSNAEKARKQLDQLSALSEEMKLDLERKNKDRAFRKAHRWLSPTDYAETFQKSCKLRQANTCHWIYEDTVFKNWRDGDWSIQIPAKKSLLSANVLWIRGKAGCGKTVLASAIVTELEDVGLASGEHPTVCYYFFTCQYQGSPEATTTAAYRAILSQILYHHRNDNSIMEKFAFSIAVGTAQLKGSSGELVDLLRLCCQQLGCVYLVLDGVDECDDNADLVTTLHALTTCSCVKVVMLSRANVSSLNRAVKATQRLEMDRTKLDTDIRLYLFTEISALIEDELLPPSDTTDLVCNLVNGADGMFLWAKLMINYLHSVALTPMKRLTTIRQVILPEGLEKMYDRILDLISHSGRTEQHLAEQIFSWAIHAKKPLTIRQIYEAAHFHYFEKDNEGLYQNAAFRDTVDIVCGSLIECFLQKQPIRRIKMGAQNARHQQDESPNEDEFTIRFMHISVKEYFMQASRRSKCNNSFLFVPREPDVHLDLARYCLEYMISTLPQSSNRPLAFISYSSLHWVDHLVDTMKSNQISDHGSSQFPEDKLRHLTAALDTFLHSPAVIVSWMYLYLSTASTSTEQYLPLHDLSTWACWATNPRFSSSAFKEMQQLSQLMSEFIRDMHTVIDTWGNKLKLYPDIVWDEVSVFSSSRFLTKNHTTKVTSLSPMPIGSHNRSSRPLCTISTTAADFSIHGVLSVWPSKQYEDRWRDLKAYDPVSRVQDMCSGWIARYEVWDALGQRCLADMRVPIDKEEIWLHMRQSLYEKAGDWSTSFPLEISKDAQCFVILRTVFIFHPPNDSSPATYQTVVLPVHLLKDHGTRWSADMKSYEPLDSDIKDLPLRAVHRDRYTYRVTFCPNGRYLSFMEKSGSGSLAVFELIRTTVPQVKLVNWSPLAAFSTGSINTLFHPSADLMAISTLGGLWIWNFTNGGDGILRLQSYLSRTAPDISISDCGKYVVLVGKGLPIVVEIPKIPPRNTLEIVDQKNPGPNGLATIGNMDLSEFTFRTEQLQKAGSVVSCRNGKVSSVVTVKSGDRPTILITEVGQRAGTELELLNLPPSVDMDHSTPSIMIPKYPRDTVQLAINMNSRSDYSMIGRQDSNLPMLIERDARAVRRLVSTNNNRKNMIAFEDDDEVMGDCFR